MRYSELAEDISDSYDDIINKIPYVEHLDNDNSGYMYWETYFIPGTVFRFYIHNEMDTTTDIATITLSVEIDPDYMNHSDFSQKTHDIVKFEVDLEKYDDGNSDKERNRTYDELQKGVDKQLDALREEAQFCLKNIEKDLDDSQSVEQMSDILIKDHFWTVQEWVIMSEIIEISGFDISEIPNTLRAFNLNEDERFLPQAVKDMFIF